LQRDASDRGQSTGLSRHRGIRAISNVSAKLPSFSRVVFFHELYYELTTTTDRASAAPTETRTAHQPKRRRTGKKTQRNARHTDTEREGTRQWKNSSKLQNRTDAGRGIPVRDYLSCDALVHRIIPPCAMNSQVRTTNHVLSEYRVA